jgi:hypothetical protein
MATERQLAANRANARRSTGPRSIGGKKRVSGNAYRHGLSLTISSIVPYTKSMDDLAKKIVGGAADAQRLQQARAVAEAEHDLRRVRMTKITLIRRVHAFGALDPVPWLKGWREIKAALRLYDQGLEPAGPIDPASTMPTEEPARTAEAVRRVLPELRRLERYERRAAARRRRAIRAFMHAGR